MKKFNLGKFNLSSESEFSIAANSEIEIISGVSEVLVEKTISGSSDFNFYAQATAVVEKRGEIEEPLTIEVSGNALNTILVYGEGKTSEIVIEAAAMGQMLGEDFLELKGFALQPGQEIEINLCDLTALVNGENAIHLLGEGADFFDLSSGANEILIEVDDGANFSIESLWKDRWL